MGQYKHLLAPLTIRGKTFRNRMLAGPTGFAYFLRGPLAEGTMAMLEERAAGGQAAVCVGENPVSYGHGRSDDPGHGAGPRYNMRDTDGEDFKLLRDTAKLIQKHGALAFMELTHPGSAGAPDDEYPDIYGPVAYTRPDGVEVKAYDAGQMEITKRDFAQAALFMKQAGYDGVLIHGGHGFLFTQFFSPLSNTRTDEYGGPSIRDRARFPLEILRAVREAVGEDFLIELRISGSERLEGGVTAGMMAEFSTMLSGLVDILHVSSGHYFKSYRTWEFSSLYQPHGCNVDTARVIARSAPADVHVGVIGGINSPEMGEQFIRDGIVDFIIMGRQMFADPAFANKTAEGRADDIQRCVRCMRCYKGSVEHPAEIAYNETHERKEPPADPKAAFCTVNPAACGFARPAYLWEPAEEKKNVLVIGGGIAGMMAAVTACDRGHNVTLLEKSGRLGGLLWFTDSEPVKEDLKNFRDLLIKRLGERDIKVMLNTGASQEVIRDCAPDAVFIAVGSSAIVPPISGIENAVPALDVYKPGCDLKQRIIMIGGGMVGCDTAVYLAEKGHTVTIVEMQDRVALEMSCMQFTSVADKLDELGVTCLTQTKCLSIAPNAVKALAPNGEELLLECDEVIFSLGMRANAATVEQIKQMIPTDVSIRVVGDCTRAARAGDASRAAYLAAIEL